MGGRTVGLINRVEVAQVRAVFAARPDSARYDYEKTRARYLLKYRALLFYCNYLQPSLMRISGRVSCSACCFNLVRNTDRRSIDKRAIPLIVTPDGICFLDIDRL